MSDFRFCVDYNQEDCTIVLHGVYYAETHDVMYLRNGDPGYPGCPAEVAIDGIEIQVPGSNRTFVTTPEDWEHDRIKEFEDYVLNNPPERD